MPETTAQPMNQRGHQRVQFFRLRVDDDFVPVFAFTPAQDADAIAAVVVDMSEGGVQVLCSAEDFVPTAHYHFALVDADTGRIRNPESWVVRRVWSREHGMYLKCGFSFAADDATAAPLITQIEQAQHHLLRCVLHPLKTIN